MILGERIDDAKYDFNNINTNEKRFDDYFSNGQYTNASKQVYKLRDAINYLNKVGRPLTDQEMAMFKM